MTPIWNEEIERIKQDPEASVFLVSFASQAEAKSTIHRLSFAKPITKDGKTGLALPGHVSFKVGKSPDGNLWILLAGRLSADESLEAYELFGIYGGEQITVIPSHVQTRITGEETAPTEIVPVQKPAAGASTNGVNLISDVANNGSTPQKPDVVASTPAPVIATKPQESTVVVPAQTPAKITPAVAPVVANAPQTPIEISPVTGVLRAAHALPKVAPLQEPDGVVSVQEPVKVSPVQKVILPKPTQGPAIAKASPSPAESSLTSVAAKVAPPEPAKVVSLQSPAKVMPTPVVSAAPSPKEVKPASPPITPASDDQPGTRIYLAKDGARQGPFTLEHINAEIIAKRYQDDDFWAWHDGLPEWIPLYKLSGVCKPAKA